MGLGCPLLLGLSDRRLRRCAATVLQVVFLSVAIFYGKSDDQPLIFDYLFAEGKSNLGTLIVSKQRRGELTKMIIIISTRKIITTLLFLYYQFSYLYFFLGGKFNCLHAKLRVQKGRSILQIITS